MKLFSFVLPMATMCLISSIRVGFAQQKHQHSKTPSKTDSSQAQSSKTSAVKTASDSASTPSAADAKHSSSIAEIVGRYIDLKNALANDKTKEAAAAGTALESAFKKF